MAFLIDREVRDLLFGDAMFSADGRADIQSEYTPDHRRHFELAEILEHRVDALRSAPRRLKSTHGEHDWLRMGVEAKRVGNFTSHFLGCFVDLTGDEAGIGVADAIHSSHEVLLLR
jgi:hypothetical protein